MARSGVESLRIFLAWSSMETASRASTTGHSPTARSRPPRALTSDPLERAHHACWASERPNSDYPTRPPPREPSLYAKFMSQLIARYGPKGSFWTANPTVPKVPIRKWQLWNEQMAPWFWDSKPWAKSYTKMLKVTYRAIHKR